MKRSEIYLRAAEIVDRGDYIYSCNAISHSLDDMPQIDFKLAYKARSEYTELFDLYSSRVVQELPNHKLVRVLMLCLASAIAESEGE